MRTLLFFFFFYLSAILGGTFLLLLFLSISLLEISKHFLKHFFFFFNVSHRFRRKGLVGLAERLMTVSKAHAVARELRLILLSNH